MSSGHLEKLADVVEVKPRRGIVVNSTHVPRQGVAPNFRIDGTTDAIRASTRVFKAGRTTGWTEGNVTALNVLDGGPGPSIQER